ncbi:Peptide deformylase 1 [Candidatus Profftia lariciata]|uniref:peptide deformylase n=1 Tax=Candidatus Profftia lariciata TaxID=1987921 RepID=UPI001D0266A5|nr:peptide deformylase [Candidatus Profftia lariciata]UDG81701.1 Peptide deformylase 1 [Candidatus Profftia lariciata]
MILLSILHFPDKRLRTIAQLVTEITPNTKHIINNMLYTMYAKDGIGLAATQIDIHRRIIVIDISENKNKPLVLINPELITSYGQISIKEGCLSIPEQHALIERAAYVKVKALDHNGKSFILEAENLLAICIQHEIDHLFGKLFIDYLSPLKRYRISKKLKKTYRHLLKA